MRKINFLLEFSKNILKKENLKPVLSYIAHNLKCSGTLKQRGDKVFLEVDKNFVFGIKKLLNEKFPQLPSDFGLNIGEIEVINENEFFLNDLDNIKETFQNIKFFIKGFYSIKPSNEQDIEKIYFLEIECDELESIRRKYGLAPKPFGRNFHLPIAFIKATNKKIMPNTFKINIAYIAA